MPSKSFTAKTSVARHHYILLLLSWLALGLLSLSCSDDEQISTNNAAKPSDAETEDASDSPDAAEDIGDGSDADASNRDTSPDAARPQDTRPAPPDSDAEEPADISSDAGPTTLYIEQIRPSSGSIRGGSSFRLRGGGFSADSVLYFGDKPAAVTLVGDELVGESPPGDSVGAVPLKVLDPQLGSAVLADGFRYTADITLLSVEPSRIPTEGGVELTITGRGFEDDSRVSFNGLTAHTQAVIGQESMRVIAPPNPAGPADLRLSNHLGQATLPGGIEYFEALNAQQLRPASGASAGGTRAELSGRGFVDGMRVELGGAEATLESLSSDGRRATIITPPGAPGLADLRVENPRGDSSWLEDAFYYQQSGSEFSIAALTPTRVSTAGGAAITLIGSGLDAAELEVEIDEVPGTVIEQGPGHARVQTPPHPPGTVDIIARDGADKTSSLPQALTYIRALEIDQITPDQGDISGGDTVTISGSGFEGVRRVEFGGRPAEFTVEDDATILATTPAHAAGAVDIRLLADLEAALPSGFRYTEALELFGSSPTRGSIAGGTYITMRGQGFDEEISVEFGGLPARDIELLDGQTITLRTPPHPSGEVEVQAKRSADSSVAPAPYTYFNPAGRLGGAWGDPIDGALNVSVFVGGGGPIEGAFVQLSTRADALYSGETNADGMITFSGPDLRGEQTVTAVAPGYSSASIQRVDAENITLFLFPPPEDDGEQPLPRAPAIFSGRLSGLNKIDLLDTDEIPLAMIQTTRADPWSDLPDPGPEATLTADGRYRLNSRDGDVALIAVGGVYNTSTGGFRPLMMAVERFLVASAGEEQTVDLELDIELNRSLSFKLTNAHHHPDGPDINRVQPWLDLGIDGVFDGLGLAEGSEDLLRSERLPALEGALSDASWWAIGGSYTQGVGYPEAEAFKKHITDTSTTVQMPSLPPIARVTSPQWSEAPENGMIHFDAESTTPPDFYYIQLVTAERARVWEGFIDGEETSFKFPDFPDFSHLPEAELPVPYPGGSYQLYIIGIRESGSSVDDFSYANLTLNGWEAYSLWAQIMAF